MTQNKTTDFFADGRPSVSIDGGPQHYIDPGEWEYFTVTSTGSSGSFTVSDAQPVITNTSTITFQWGDEECEDLDWDEETSVVKVLFPETGDIHESPAPEGLGWQLYAKKEFKPYEAVASDFGGFSDEGDEYYLDIEFPAEKDEKTYATKSESYIFSQQHQRCWLGDFGHRLTQEKCVVLETKVFVRDEEDSVPDHNKYDMDFEDDDII